jgi:hypothetical protein
MINKRNRERGRDSMHCPVNLFRRIVCVSPEVVSAMRVLRSYIRFMGLPAVCRTDREATAAMGSRSVIVTHLVELRRLSSWRGPGKWVRSRAALAAIPRFQVSISSPFRGETTYFDGS